MRIPLAILVMCLLVIADISYQCSERIGTRAGTGKARDEAVEDWENATYLAVVIGLAGVGWLAASAVPVSRRLARLTWPISRYGAGAALVCGLVAIAVVGISALVAGTAPKDYWNHRYELECFWLFGAALGGLFGSAVGTGLGAAAYGSRRPWPPAADPEKENYRDGPNGSATKQSRHKSGIAPDPRIDYEP